MKKLFLLLSLISLNSLQAITVYNNSDKAIEVGEERYASGIEIGHVPQVLMPKQYWSSSSDTIEISVRAQDNSFRKHFIDDTANPWGRHAVVNVFNIGRTIDALILFPKQFESQD